MPLPSDNVNVSITDQNAVRVLLRLAQAKCRTRLLTIDQLLVAVNEADRTCDGLGLTESERVGMRIEVSPSDENRAPRWVPMATFAELRRTRSGWRLVRIERRPSRRAQTTWVATSTPSSSVLASAAARTLRRGTNGQSWMHLDVRGTDEGEHAR